eukprot:3934556-Rhodomonas_salina.3
MEVVDPAARPRYGHEVAVEEAHHIAVAAALVLQKLGQVLKVGLPRRQTPQELRPPGVEKVYHEGPSVRLQCTAHAKLVCYVGNPLRVGQAPQENEKGRVRADAHALGQQKLLVLTPMIDKLQLPKPHHEVPSPEAEEA